MSWLVPELIPPFPRGRTLRALFEGDDFAPEMCAGPGEALAPVVARSRMPAGLPGPGTTLLDVLHWLTGWVAQPLDAVVAGVKPAHVPREVEVLAVG